LESLALPIVQAPMAGGISTPQLAAAVTGAGGLGFLASGYLAADQVRADIASVRALTDGAFGVNVFVPGENDADSEAVANYARRLETEASQLSVALGEPRFDDDGFEDKIALLTEDPVAVVSFTFGVPPKDVVDRLHTAGSDVWITVTSPGEARQATAVDP